VLVSSEMPELLLLSDRIIVMCEGRLTGELNVPDDGSPDIELNANDGLGRVMSQSNILTLATKRGQ